MEKPDYDVTLCSADNGLIVRVGCKTIVVMEDKVDEALADVKYYLTGGYKARRELGVKWLKEPEQDEQCEQEVPQCGTIAPPPPPLNARR